MFWYEELSGGEEEFFKKQIFKLDNSVIPFE